MDAFDEERNQLRIRAKEINTSMGVSALGGEGGIGSSRWNQPLEGKAGSKRSISSED